MLKTGGGTPGKTKACRGEKLTKPNQKKPRSKQNKENTAENKREQNGVPGQGKGEKEEAVEQESSLAEESGKEKARGTPATRMGQAGVPRYVLRPIAALRLHRHPPPPQPHALEYEAQQGPPPDRFAQ